MMMAELYTADKVTEQCKEDLGADPHKIVRRSTRPIPKVNLYFDFDFLHVISKVLRLHHVLIKAINLYHFHSKGCRMKVTMVEEFLGIPNKETHRRYTTAWQCGMIHVFIKHR
ncbi:hypothetical protein GOP47_0015196 [Adiantum capillus-veneris]|uniref:Uncharacterized protein n=1 Tax=Adiantum capillus-veneris TaxID=13818 RepID=A0A9D4ZCV2_ADICA|nr:hypothetical protein GOP47_0015196 [Adiantum capillus-veneris]